MAGVKFFYEMRDLKNLNDSFVPQHEKEWDSRLFIDSAIKQQVEHQLEVMARALSGICEVKFRTYQEPQSHVIYQETDENNYPQKTIHYTMEVKVDAYCFFGHNKIELLTQIINFWAGKQSVFPCGGAHFPNIKISTCFNDLHSQKK